MRRWLLLITLAGFMRAECLPDGAESRFEVASVKAVGPYSNERSPSLRGGPGTSDPERITWENVSLIGLINRAYGVEFGRISGPEWLSVEQYTVTAKIPAGATKEELAPMWRNLLEERFHLAVHHTTKELPVYELVVAKGGPRLKASAGDPGKPVPGGPRAMPDAKGFPILPPGVRNTVFMPTEDGERVTRETFRDFSMEDFAKNLAWPLGTPIWEHVISTGTVLDRTGLSGRYDFTLEYLGIYYPGGAFPAPRADGLPSHVANLFEALPQQLGLRLRETKAPMDVLVIDHADRVPTEN